MLVPEGISNMLLSLFLHLDTFHNMGRGLMTEGFWSQLPRGLTSRGLGVEEAGVEVELGWCMESIGILGLGTHKGF